MAKHVKGKAVSKGERISCKGNVKAAPKQMTGNDNLVVKEAFLGAKFPASLAGSSLGAAIIKAAQAPVRKTQEQARGWSAKLSFRTFKALQEQGVMA